MKLWLVLDIKLNLRKLVGVFPMTAREVFRAIWPSIVNVALSILALEKDS
ncbi:unnamed protein product [Acidithrix sp. C25]|nr:unnamed protein product [Acidithrix sp. C25]